MPVDLTTENNTVVDADQLRYQTWDACGIDYSDQQSCRYWTCQATKRGMPVVLTTPINKVVDTEPARLPNVGSLRTIQLSTLSQL